MYREIVEKREEVELFELNKSGDLRPDEKNAGNDEDSLISPNKIFFQENSDSSFDALGTS